ncbi:sugar phosphate isomerase/epimerase family protein [Streptococcus pseudoporcinus]|uniref:AP endonuclease, family 2 n=1 Tax=Streptococcus pseudoporcinus LQ 940-04 TaxID=875093 RepID=G5KBK5_9STRE|nr:sugar phosphate isomerase/epimerase [Streptococcus pseudoporcinus]EFR45385.1 AP endonuclease, family 2 [Streptococcus pseudoporcinus SPIN 20026]EHI65013.1 AP endonuclease, family 2 [Streptococcus pseudoporcinus LQ 940-04]VEF92861.1 xylose isomerase-like TIM barrel family protein [Streptococcus pseudoporcinus]
MTFKITINLDEISDNLEDSLTFLNDLSVTSCELRVINGKNLIQLNDDELIHLKETLRRYNITPISIASPLFKWQIGTHNTEDIIDLYGVSSTITIDQQWLYLRKIVFIAQLFEIKYVRIFGGIGCSTEEFLKNELFLNLLKEETLIFLIENELGTSVSRAEDLQKIASFIDDKSVKNLKIWFDIANYYRLDQNVEEALCQFKEYIYYIHCKNYLPDDKKVRYVELGKGIINFKKVIKKIGQNFTHLIFSLETHEREPSKKKDSVKNSFLTLTKYINGDKK